MKQTTLILAIFLSSCLLMGQVYIPPEGFEGEEFPPPGWTIENGADDNTFEQGPMPVTTEPMCAWIQNSQYIEIDDRLISPAFDLPVGTDAKLYAQLRGSVGYALAMYWDPDNLVRYFFEISTDGGNTWEVVLDFDDQEGMLAAGATWPWADWEWFDVAIDISAYAGQTIQFAFHHEKAYDPQGGGSYGITNVGVWEEVENDAQVLSLNIPDYGLAYTEVEIAGTLKNIGSNPITSFEGEYYINGELTETFSIENVNVSAFETLEFVAGNPTLFTEVAIHEVELVISNVNGVVNNSPENNSLIKNISIASELVERKPFFEMFTSATCGPCVEANENLTQVLGNNADSTYSLVKYQVNWPGNGDPYFIEDNGIRVDYYNVSGVPSFFINGLKSDQTYMFNQNDFNEASSTEAFVDITLNHDFDGINVEAMATIDPKLYVEDVTIHMAIVEKTTYNNTSTNGETEFHHVVMAMLPDGNGTSAALEAGSQIEINESANLITTYIEEYDDLMLVVWVHDENTQNVLQSESYDLTITTGVSDPAYSKVMIYPNPNTGLFTVQGIEDCYLEILDLTGRPVLSKHSSVNISTINISDIDKGIYFVRIVKENEVVCNQKIILK